MTIRAGRRIAIAGAGELGVQAEIVESCLIHLQPRVDFADEARVTMTASADTAHGFVAGTWDEAGRGVRANRRIFRIPLVATDAADARLAVHALGMLLGGNAQLRFGQRCVAGRARVRVSLGSRQAPFLQLFELRLGDLPGAALPLAAAAGLSVAAAGSALPAAGGCWAKAFVTATSVASSANRMALEHRMDRQRDSEEQEQPGDHRRDT
jgi:hypothetical protein